MDMNQSPYMGLSGITPEELAVIQQATAELSENQHKYFYMNYTSKRKSPQDMLIFCIVGLCVVPGLQRFIVGQIGMGFLYLVTWGLFLFGTISDIVRYQEIAFTYNQQLAKRIANNLMPSRHELPTYREGRDSGLISQRHRHA